MTTATKHKQTCSEEVEKAAESVGRHAKREAALVHREAGKTYKEIAALCGYANPGAACNGVKRARVAAEAAAKKSK